MTFLKLNHRSSRSQGEFDFRPAHFEAFEQIPGSVVLFSKLGMGLGYDAVMISFHTTFNTFDTFKRRMIRRMNSYIEDSNFFLINLEDGESSIPLTFSLLANQILTSFTEETTNEAKKAKRR